MLSMRRAYIKCNVARASSDIEICLNIGLVADPLSINKRGVIADGAMETNLKALLSINKNIIFWDEYFRTKEKCYCRLSIIQCDVFS